MKQRNSNNIYRSSLSSLISWEQLKSVQWKNNRANGREAYCPTRIEHLANVVTHGVWIAPSIWAWVLLVRRAISPPQFLAALVYGAALVALFAVSTWFHSVFYCGRNAKLKDVLHRCDRAMIYVFIAGSYFPWLTVGSLQGTDSSRWLVWIFAAIGIAYQQIFHERFKTFETIMYLLMGIYPAIIILTQEHEFGGMAELKLGFLIYMSGVIFFKADGRVPCAHAIWHLHVGLAAGIHYFAVLHHLFPDPTTNSL